MATKHGLGRGLSALIKDGAPTVAPPESPPPSSGVLSVPLRDVRRSRLQPRSRIAPEALEELTASVRAHGVLQPLLVRAAADGGYELIAGERRLTAAGQAGLKEVPVRVIVADDTQALQMALVENLQREDLNPVEEAEGYHVLAQTFHLTQEQIAERVGKARATVANGLRLLGLPRPVLDMVRDGRLSAGHAKVLTGVSVPEEQALLAQRALREELSVRKLERIVQRLGAAPRRPRAVRADIPADHLAYLSDKLHAHFGTAVRLTPCRTYANGKKAKGTLEIDFYSNDDLDRVLTLLGFSESA
jgi:ParB family transcriptional regulator, chromosome partitioning protein